MTEFDFEYRVGKLALNPGDMLVVKVDTYLTLDMAAQAKRHFERAVPGTNVIIIERGVDLSVLTAAELAQRSAA